MANAQLSQFSFGMLLLLLLYFLTLTGLANRRHTTNSPVMHGLKALATHALYYKGALAWYTQVS